MLAAQRAVSSLVGEMDWKDGSAQEGSYRSAKEALGEMGCVKSNTGKNLLLFFVTSETRMPNTRNPDAQPIPTSQAKMTESAITKTFETDTYKVLIGSECFECYKIDVTDVTPQENRFFCSATAPAIVLIDKTGAAKGTLTGNQITESTVFSIMARICAADKINLARIVSAASGYAKAIYMTEYKIHSADTTHTAAVAECSRKGTPANQRRADSAKQVLDQLQQQRDNLVEKYREAVRALLGESAKTAAN
jgi:hypothetical protein